jgi:hypothetical protein
MVAAGSDYSENADGFTYTDVLLQYGTKAQLAINGLARSPVAIGDYVTSNVLCVYYSTNSSSKMEGGEATAAKSKGSPAIV